MLGTIVNTCSIITGTIIGCLLHREENKNMLYDALGLASLAIGLNATISNFPKVISLAVYFVTRHRRWQAQPSTLTEDLNVWWQDIRRIILRIWLMDCLPPSCSTIGPLSMLGPVISALKGDNTFLYTNSTLDFVSSTIFASTYGIGMVLAAPVLFCWQGMFYLIADISSSAISNALMAELLIVGRLMITASGLSLLNLKDCKTLNPLPSLLIPVIWFWLKQ